MSFSILLSKQMKSISHSVYHHAHGCYQLGSRRHCPFSTKSNLKNKGSDLVQSAVGLCNYRTKYSLQDAHEEESISSTDYQFQTIFDIGSVVADDRKVANFSEQTYEWIVDSVQSHMDTRGDSYIFRKSDIKLLSNDPQSAKALISCTAQHTSQWLINRMLADRHFVHSFTKSNDFKPLENLFKITSAAEHTTKDGVKTMDYKADNIRIEQREATEVDQEWMQDRGYNEHFDVIFDGQSVDNMVFDEYVNTTIFGQSLKKGGVIYVSDRKITGDIAGRKLRSKMEGLYPNSHFELIAERDTAWDTQFVFLKALSCSEMNMERECDRRDEWGEGHVRYVQSSIWNRSKVRENAGRDMCEGLERITNAIEDDANPHRKRTKPELPWFSSLK